MTNLKDWKERVEWLLTFNGVIWWYDLGYAAKLEISYSKNDISPEKPEGISYSFTFHEPGIAGRVGKRVYGFDNAHSPDKKPPFDHEHKTKWVAGEPREAKGSRFKEASVFKAFERFPAGCASILNQLGLPSDPSSTTNSPRAESKKVAAVEPKPAANKHRKKGTRK